MTIGNRDSNKHTQRQILSKAGPSEVNQCLRQWHFSVVQSISCSGEWGTWPHKGRWLRLEECLFLIQLNPSAVYRICYMESHVLERKQPNFVYTNVLDNGKLVAN